MLDYQFALKRKWNEHGRVTRAVVARCIVRLPRRISTAFARFRYVPRGPGDVIFVRSVIDWQRDSRAAGKSARDSCNAMPSAHCGEIELCFGERILEMNRFDFCDRAYLRRSAVTSTHHEHPQSSPVQDENRYHPNWRNDGRTWPASYEDGDGERRPASNDDLGVGDLPVPNGAAQC